MLKAGTSPTNLLNLTFVVVVAPSLQRVLDADEAVIEEKVYAFAPRYFNVVLINTSANSSGLEAGVSQAVVTKPMNLRRNLPAQVPALPVQSHTRDTVSLLYIVSLGSLP